MATKPIFVNRVTTIPAEWANNVSTLVYDVFGVATTIEDVRRKLALTTTSGHVNIKGGSINGTVIGDEIPTHGRFTRLTVTALSPNDAGDVTTKYYVDNAITAGLNSLALQSMSQQRHNNVSITGGQATLDVLRSRATPTIDEDVITFKYYEDTKPRIQQALTPMVVSADNRTVTAPFKIVSGALVIFVDQLYQLPDQYEIVGDYVFRFFTDLPSNAVVGGFCLSTEI